MFIFDNFSLKNENLDLIFSEFISSITTHTHTHPHTRVPNKHLLNICIEKVSLFHIYVNQKLQYTEFKYILEYFSKLEYFAYLPTLKNTLGP